MDQQKTKTSGLLFCGEDELTARVEVQKIKAGGDGCVMASGFAELESTPADWVIIMPDVPGFRAQAIKEMYGDKVVQEEEAAVSTDDGTLEPARRRPGRPRKTPAPILANIE